MPMHGRMPVVAAVECGSQPPWGSYICIAVQGMANFVRIFLVDARECQIRESLSSLDVKTGGSRCGLSTHNVRHDNEEDSTKCGLHRLATLNQTSAGLKPFHPTAVSTTRRPVPTPRDTSSPNQDHQPRSQPRIQSRLH